MVYNWNCEYCGSYKLAEIKRKSVAGGIEHESTTILEIHMLDAELRNDPGVISCTIYCSNCGIVYRPESVGWFK